MKHTLVKNLAQNIFNDLEEIRKQSPLIHNITNFVTMDFSANALLALGASPIMAHAPEEVEEMTKHSSALLLNIGTLSSDWIESMRLSFHSAKKNNIPIIFDPVGCGGSAYRTQVSCEFLNLNPSITKGNGSEILSLFGKDLQTKGVTNLANPSTILSSLETIQKKLNKNQHKSVIAITGPVDYVLSSQSLSHQTQIKNGSPQMTKVTGMGCTLGSIIASFSAINPDPFLATQNAIAFFGIVGELASKESKGIGSFKVNFLDKIENIKKEDIETHLKIKTLPLNPKSLNQSH